jgi:DNA (cytosine-5)-methyltransferase 1
MVAYYNEHDVYAAQWLRNLIDAGLIAPGVVDERSITEVRPDDLDGFTQCHFFAGIGGWSVALRLAGWDDNRSVWTGSCPCQPFSAAGKRNGHQDERHLWPVFCELIRAQRPGIVFGEQVASAAVVGTVKGDRPASAGDAPVWFDGVSADLEAEGYAVGAAVLGAHSVGAPHIRQRLFWVGESIGSRSQGHAGHGDGSGKPERLDDAGELENSIPSLGTMSRGDCRDDERVGNANSQRLAERQERDSNEKTRLKTQYRPDTVRPDHRLEYAAGDGRQQGRAESDGRLAASGCRSDAWSEYRIAPCRDERARRVGPSASVLAHGVSGRVAVRSSDGQAAAEHWYNPVGALKGFGNAIVPQVAAAFIQAFDACNNS